MKNNRRCTAVVVFWPTKGKSRTRHRTVSPLNEVSWEMDQLEMAVQSPAHTHRKPVQRTDIGSCQGSQQDGDPPFGTSNRSSSSLSRPVPCEEAMSPLTATATEQEPFPHVVKGQEPASRTPLKLQSRLQLHHYLNPCMTAWMIFNWQKLSRSLVGRQKPRRQ